MLTYFILIIKGMGKIDPKFTKYQYLMKYIYALLTIVKNVLKMLKKIKTVIGLILCKVKIAYNDVSDRI